MATRSHNRVLLAVLFLVFVALPLLDTGRIVSGLAVVLLLNVVAIAGVYSVSGSRRLLWVGRGLAAVSIVLLLVGATLEVHAVSLAGFAALALMLGYLVVELVRALFAAPRVTGETIGAAVSGYLLIGLLWALVYVLLLAGDAGAIRALPEGGQFSAILYFSFTTLTTLGYGDLAPVSRVARSLATLEAVVGQLYIAITIARLVGLQIASPRAPGG